MLVAVPTAVMKGKVLHAVVLAFLVVAARGSRTKSSVAAAEKDPFEFLRRGVESFLYWSKETFAPKPIISVTHVSIMHGEPRSGTPDVIIASAEVFATHYVNGALGLTLLLRGPDASSSRYLVYVNRTSVDGVRALWRPIVEGRVKRQAAKVFATARDRIERGAHTQALDPGEPEKRATLTLKD